MLPICLITEKLWPFSYCHRSLQSKILITFLFLWLFVVIVSLASAMARQPFSWGLPFYCPISLTVTIEPDQFLPGPPLPHVCVSIYSVYMCAITSAFSVFPSGVRA